MELLGLILAQADKALLHVAGQRQENLDQIRATQHRLADLERAKQEAYQAGMPLDADLIRLARLLRTWFCRLHTEQEALQAERDRILNARQQALD